jgi:hypothetical protein
MISEMMALMMGAKMLVTLAVYVGLGAVQCMREGNDVMAALPGLVLNGVVFVVVLTVVMVGLGKLGMMGM